MKQDTKFECSECGYQSLKFYGRCPQCQGWNTIVEKEELPESSTTGNAAKITRLDDVVPGEIARISSGLPEFDRLLGGGIVSDSVILIGGEPGVGKSTLLLQIAANLASQGHPVLYYSGEESASQIKLRSSRLNICSGDLYLVTGGSIEEMADQVNRLAPKVIIIDSIQTIHSQHSSHNTGSPMALRYLTAEISNLAKSRGITVFIIGHITKEGVLAGPKTLEHMVDVVLYFQGDLKLDVRILRAEKNRFGAANEIGIFSMTENGLNSILDPSRVFIQHRHSHEPGITLFPTANGQRIILIEVQALVAESPLAANPRRIALGFDSYKMAMLISILEKKLKFPFYKSDIFLNITGGLAVRDTAADLAVCASLISSYKNLIIPPESVFIGEIGLTGEIRPVSLLDQRIRESARQGFRKVFVPSSQKSKGDGIEVVPLETIHDLFIRLKNSSL